MSTTHFKKEHSQNYSITNRSCSNDNSYPNKGSTPINKYVHSAWKGTHITFDMSDDEEKSIEDEKYVHPAWKGTHITFGMSDDEENSTKDIEPVGCEPVGCEPVGCGYDIKYGAEFTGDVRSFLYRKFNQNEKIVVIMNSPSTADAKTDDVTTKRLNNIIINNGYGGYFIININVKDWEKQIDKFKNFKAVIAWGYRTRMKKRTKILREKMSTTFSCLFEFEAKCHESQPTMLSYNTRLIPIVYI